MMPVILLVAEVLVLAVVVVVVFLAVIVIVLVLVLVFVPHLLLLVRSALVTCRRRRRCRRRPRRRRYVGCDGACSRLRASEMAIAVVVGDNGGGNGDDAGGVGMRTPRNDYSLVLRQAYATGNAQHTCTLAP